MNDVRNNVLKDSIQTLAVRIVNVATAAALGILTARLLGPEQRGLYVLPTIDAALGSALFGGLGSATTYFMLSQGRGRGVLRSASLTGALYVLTGVAVVALLGVWQHRIWTILPSAAALPALAVISVAGGYCFGIGRVTYANALTLLGSAAGVALMALGLLLFTRNAGTAVTMWLSSTTLTGAIAAVFLWRHSRLLENTGVSDRAYFVFAGKSGLTNVLSILNLRVDVYIIAALTSPATLGIYTVAVAGAESLKILTLVLSQTAAPRIGSLPQSESARFTARCVRNNFLTAVVPCLLIIAGARLLLDVLYGAKFAAAAVPLQILTIGVFASSPGAILAAFYTLKLGRPMVSFWNNVLSATICAVVSVLLIPRLGMIGAAWGSTSAYIVSQVVLIRLFVKENDLRVRTVLLAQPEDLVVLQRAADGIVRRMLRMLVADRS